MEEFKSAKESRVSITELMLPSHSNFGGKVHGAIFSTLWIKLPLPVPLNTRNVIV